MKTILFLSALTFKIFLCLYPGRKHPAREKISEPPIEVSKTATDKIERQSMSYSSMLKNKASALSQK